MVKSNQKLKKNLLPFDLFEWGIRADSDVTPLTPSVDKRRVKLLFFFVKQSGYKYLLRIKKVKKKTARQCCFRIQTES